VVEAEPLILITAEDAAVASAFLAQDTPHVLPQHVPPPHVAARHPLDDETLRREVDRLRHGRLAFHLLLGASCALCGAMLGLFLAPCAARGRRAAAAALARTTTTTTTATVTAGPLYSLADACCVGRGPRYPGCSRPAAGGDPSLTVPLAAAAAEDCEEGRVGGDSGNSSGRASASASTPVSPRARIHVLGGGAREPSFGYQPLRG
jgi:hypothetical protein